MPRARGLEGPLRLELNWNGFLKLFVVWTALNYLYHDCLLPKAQQTAKSGLEFGAEIWMR